MTDTMANDHRLRELRERDDPEVAWLIARCEELEQEAELAEMGREMERHEAYGEGWAAAVATGEVDLEVERRIIDKVTEAVQALRPPVG